MNAKNAVGATLLTSAIATLLSSSALGQVHPEKPTYKYEKCYGVARAGAQRLLLLGKLLCWHGERGPGSTSMDLRSAEGPARRFQAARWNRRSGVESCLDVVRPLTDSVR